MIDTDFSLLLALILFIVLIMFDFAFYRFRERQHEHNESTFSPIQDIIRRLREWGGNILQKPSFIIPLRQESDSASISGELPEGAAPESATSQPPARKTGKTAKGRPTVHVQLSADIPEGSKVHITIEVVNGEGKTIVREETLYGAAAQSKSAAAEAERSPLGLIVLMPVLAFNWLFQNIRKLLTTPDQWRSANLQRNLFWGAVAIYALVVSAGIDRFPIYFFTDEAVPMNMAEDFVNSGFTNYSGEFLPTFFIVEGWVNGTSVYVQVLPYLLFGKSIIVTRLVSAFFTFLGAIALGLLLKHVMKVKYYWAGVLLLLTTPAWFLHARTVFEYAEVAAFYTIFLYFYGRYRKGDLPSLYVAVFAGALCFYTHGLGEVLMGVTGLALLIVDSRYHIHPKRRKTVLLGLGLGIILILPFVRYYLVNPGEIAEQVKRRYSYWSEKDWTLVAKMTELFRQYTLGLNPWYWYTPGPNQIDLERHVMRGYGNGLLFTLPFMLVGFYQIFKTIPRLAYRLIIMGLIASPVIVTSLFAFAQSTTFVQSLAVQNNWAEDWITQAATPGLWIAMLLMLAGVILAMRKIRRPGHRLALIALLASPIPASIVAIGMPRMLWVSVSMAILTTIGLSAILHWLERRLQTSSPAPAWGLFAALTLLSGYMLWDALVNGPTWFQSYDLYGMQYGAKQIFQDTVLPELKKDPNMTMVVSPNWANGTEQFIPFFIPSEERWRIKLGQPIDQIDQLATNASSMLFVSTADEYNKLLQDPKYQAVTVLKEPVYFPNGQPGFYLISLRPSDNYADIIAAEHAVNRNPIESTIELNGQAVRIVHSPLGSGRLEDIFDDDPETISRVLEANPFIIYLYPPQPIDTHSAFIKTGTKSDFTITIRLYAPGSNEPVVYTQRYQELPSDPEFTMLFDRGPEKSERIEFEVTDNTSGETSQFHIRTIQFK